mmetsp:Transcript_993/g.1561  ORF Transcript_993/g.1561 Transcript_993/m.1561 type:complete len:89 (+) Transcript_993:220-486(+)
MVYAGTTGPLESYQYDREPDITLVHNIYVGLLQYALTWFCHHYNGYECAFSSYRLHFKTDKLGVLHVVGFSVTAASCDLLERIDSNVA